MATRADHKARVVRSWDSANRTGVDRPTITLVTDAPHAPGWAVWQVGPGGPRVACPDLSPLGPVPPEVEGRYFQRILATARGHCHQCGAAASVNVDPASTPAAWTLLEVSVGLSHSVGCPLTFDDADRPYLDPRALETR